MTTGITRELVPLSKFLVTLLMYCGRIGSMSFALAFTQQKRLVKVQNPVERINVG
jgi:trk system potassium uptake protein TrkH